MTAVYTWEKGSVIQPLLHSVPKELNRWWFLHFGDDARMKVNVKNPLNLCTQTRYLETIPLCRSILEIYWIFIVQACSSHAEFPLWAASIRKAKLILKPDGLGKPNPQVMLSWTTGLDNQELKTAVQNNLPPPLCHSEQIYLPFMAPTHHYSITIHPSIHPFGPHVGRCACRSYGVCKVTGVHACVCRCALFCEHLYCACEKFSMSMSSWVFMTVNQK